MLVCAGETFEDLVFHDLPCWPRLGEEFKTDRMLRTWGGGALLTAVAAARQGARCQVMSALAAAAVRFLRSEGVRVRNLRRANEPHALTVALSNRNDRAFVTYPGANSLVEERLLESLPRLRARHLHLALEPTRCADWVQLLSALSQRGITSSWDFGWNPDLAGRPDFRELVCQLTYLFLNEKEAELYRGCWEGCACVVIKLGERGCEAVFGQERLRVPGIAVEAVDSTGAGDAFNGGFLTGLLEGLPLSDCLAWGNRVGAASTLCAGGLAGLPKRA